MSRYIKKHRFQIMGIAGPAFALLFLAAIGLSVAPGWIKPSYGVVGQSCDSDNNNADCDVCNGEVCSHITGQTFQCVNKPFGTPNSTDPNLTDPQCPVINFPNISIQTFPGCWDLCVPELDDAETIPSCLPNDGFCEGISGGNEENFCRGATCTDNPGFQSTNPSGCDYFWDGVADPFCVNCEEPVPPPFDNCGNGVCEKDNGETFDNCSLDCRVPGFTGPKLDEGDPTLDEACGAFSPPAITFNGPPYNVSDGVLCEDGDVCTDNECVDNNECQVTAKTCNPQEEDLCCPAGCIPPDPVSGCGATTAIPNCDLDCLEQEECIPPPPTPPGEVILEGSGEAFSCALQKQRKIDPVKGALALSTLAGALGALLVLRSRKSE